MGRRPVRIPLSVLVNGRLVGKLRRQPSGAIDFQYDGSWLDWEYAFPISLSLPLREDRYVGAPVVAVLENLLPDNEPIRRRLAEQVGAPGYDAYSLLAAIGRDCVGAMQFVREGADLEQAGAVSGRPISDNEVETILRDLGRTPLGMADDDEFRISIAGAQEKTALLNWKGKWQVPHGTTPTTHILKPQIGRLGNGIDLSRSVENEHLCMTLTAAFGLPTAETSTEDFGKTRALVVTRFDRLWTRDKRLLRVPQEDCCQALSVPPSQKYEPHGGPGMARMLEFLKGSDDPFGDQRLFLKAQIVFWLLGATDGHAKNFSVRISPGGRFRLTPLYDVMSAQPNYDTKQIRRNQMKLAMAVGRGRHYVIDQIVPRHFVETAAGAGVPPDVVDAIFAELVERVPGAVDRVLKNLPKDFPRPLVKSIRDGLETRLRLVNQAKGQAS